MSDVTWNDRAHSALYRTHQEYEDLKRAYEAGHSKSKLISQSWRVAEYSLRAILYSYDIRIERTHELNNVCQKYRERLSDIWLDLEPFLEHYGWIYHERRLMDYQHADSPSYSTPPIPEENVDRALDTARRFMQLAERVLGRADDQKNQVNDVLTYCLS